MKYKVKFKRSSETEWNYCDKPFESYAQANFFALTVQLASPDFQAEVEEEEVCQKN